MMLRVICRWVFAFFILLAPVSAQTATLGDDERIGAYSETVTLEEVYGGQIVQEISGAVPPDFKIHFQLYTPPTYDPAKPAGVLVYISPTPIGRPPESWESVLDAHNLIWVSVNGSGNKQQSHKRIIEALSSLHYIAERFNVDPERLYLSGFSGGGRVSSVLVSYYPERFTGVVYLSGVNSWGEAPPSPDYVKRQTRFVFLTGSRDFNRTETRQVYEEYAQAEFERIKLMDIPGMRHTLPNAASFEEAIKFLDSFVAPKESASADVD